MDRGRTSEHERPVASGVGPQEELSTPDPEATLGWRIPTLSLLVFAGLAGLVAPWMGWAFSEADLSAGSGFDGLSPRVWTSLQLYLVLCASAVLPAALLAPTLRRRGVTWSRALGVAWPTPPGSWYGSWLRGVFGGGALISVLMVTLWLGGWLDHHPESPKLPTLTVVVLALAVAALYEELLFRGFGFWAMERLGGPVAAIAATSLLFAWAHSNNDGADLVGLLNTALAGALLGWLRWSRGHLWSAWGLHFGWNVTLGLLFGATTSGFGFVGRLARSELTNRGESQPWWSGGAYGPEASLLLTVLLLACLSYAIRRAQSSRATS